jgi:uncharacterized protein
MVRPAAIASEPVDGRLAAIAVTAMFDELPRSASWRHLGTRDGFETVVFRRGEGAVYRCEGVAVAVEDQQVWAVGYEIVLDHLWRARAASVWGRMDAAVYERRVEAIAPGRWAVDEQEAPELAGCLDIDLESSAFTNAIPVHRLGLAVGDAAAAPAIYIRASGLLVERLEQDYLRVTDDGDRIRFVYRAPAFDFEALLVYDRCGVIVDYPSIATRAS